MADENDRRHGREPEGQAARRFPDAAQAAPRAARRYEETRSTGAADGGVSEGVCCI